MTGLRLFDAGQVRFLAVGWKGGNGHLTYTQGWSAELVMMTTIGVGLPGLSVSTTRELLSDFFGHDGGQSFRPANGDPTQHSACVVNKFEGPHLSCRKLVSFRAFPAVPGGRLKLIPDNVEKT